MHLCICTFVHLYICAFVHLCICTFVHLYIYAFLGICISLPEASLWFPGIPLVPRHHSRSQAPLSFPGISIPLPEASLSFPGTTLVPRHHSRSQASTQPRPAHVAGDVAKSPILRGAVSTQPRFVPPMKMSLSRRALSGSLPCQIPNCVSQHASRLLSCT